MNDGLKISVVITAFEEFQPHPGDQADSILALGCQLQAAENIIFQVCVN